MVCINSIKKNTSQYFKLLTSIILNFSYLTYLFSKDLSLNSTVKYNLEYFCFNLLKHKQ